MTTRNWTVVLTGAPGKSDRYLSSGGMSWELDPAKADRLTQAQAEVLAAEHGVGCRAAAGITETERRGWG